MIHTSHATKLTKSSTGSEFSKWWTRQRFGNCLGNIHHKHIFKAEKWGEGKQIIWGQVDGIQKMAIVRIMETSEITQMEVKQKTIVETRLQLLEISLAYFTQYSCKTLCKTLATIVMIIWKPMMKRQWSFKPQGYSLTLIKNSRILLRSK